MSAISRAKWKAEQKRLNRVPQEHPSTIAKKEREQAERNEIAARFKLLMLGVMLSRGANAVKTLAELESKRAATLGDAGQSGRPQT